MSLRWFVPLKSPPTPKAVLGFDVEGVGGENGFTCGAVTSEAGQAFFSDPLRMWDYLLSAEHGETWRCAHNLAYDLAVVNVEALISGGALLGPGGLLWYDATDSKGEPIRFVDSGHLFRGWTVAEMGELVNLPKLELSEAAQATVELGVPWDFVSPRLKPEIEAYNRRDSEIVYKALLLLQSTVLELGGEMRETIASTSMDTFRRAYMAQGWQCLSKDFNNLARQAYYGGRTEPFIMGRSEGVNGYDANSLYPAVQSSLTFPYPGALDFHHGPKLPSDWHHREGVASVRVKVPRRHVPPLPARVGGGLFFPFGEWTACYCLHELRHALEQGAEVLSANWTLSTKATFNPFEEFVAALYAKRLDMLRKGDPREHLVKLLLNSNIGKYGVRSDAGLSTLHNLKRGFDPQRHRGTIWEQLGKHHFLEVPVERDTQPLYANTILAAYVSAGARVALHQTLTAQRGNLLYCDTDSALTYGTMPTGDGLGEWKQFLANGQADIIGPKEYLLMLDYDILQAHAKAVPPALAAEYLQAGEVRYHKALSIRQAISQGRMPGEWVETFRERGNPIPKRWPLSDNGYIPEGSTTFAWPIPDLHFLVGSTQAFRQSQQDARL